MIISLQKKFYEKIKTEIAVQPFGIEVEKLYGRDVLDINLRKYDKAGLQAWVDLFIKHKKETGALTLRQDVENWIRALSSMDGVCKVRARKLKHARDLLVEYIARLPNKQVYIREQEGVEGVTLPYYVAEIEYHPPIKSRDSYQAEYISIKLVFEMFGDMEEKNKSIDAETAVGCNAHEILVGIDLMPENEELRAAHLKQIELYEKWRDKIGMQFLARGRATNDGIDTAENDDDYRYRWNTTNIRLDLNGEPSRVLIDVFKENEKEDRYGRRKGKNSVSPWFWRNVQGRLINAQGEVEWDPTESEDGAWTADLKQDVEIPVHPYVAVFDLKRHRRLRVHVGNLTPYVYDKTLADRLILPEANRKLINILTASQKTTFSDIIKGKSGGTIIICEGKPGTGKTLTSEIYAETLGRALYTVQCSQLGLDAQALEKSLLICFARARRWNAIMLLDEADVYVHERGHSLEHNAIVGVFLRVLEYPSGTLFMTTNRGDDVDDAILSRCTARIHYETPTPEDQERIWETLARQNKIDLPIKNIRSIVADNKTLSGRDVKNLLKLAWAVAQDRDVHIDAALIAEMRRYKPTN